MRLLVHRGQALLLMVVAVLAGVAVAGAVLERDGVALLGSLRINEVFTPPRSQMPSQIVIGRGVVPSNDGGLGGAAATPVAPALSSAASAEPVQASPTTAVVPGAVYTYPPDSHGRGGGGGDGGHGRE